MAVETDRLVDLIIICCTFVIYWFVAAGAKGVFISLVAVVMRTRGTGDN